MMPFVSDSLNRKIRNLISKSNLDIRLINFGNKKLKYCFLMKKQTVKHIRTGKCVSVCL